MREANSTTIRNACLVAGPACLVAFALLSIASRAFIADFDLAFSTQLPLTMSDDIGLLVALVVLLGASPRIRPTAKGYVFVLSATGICMGALVKMGLIGGLCPQTLVVGDGLSAAFATLCLGMWLEKISAGDMATVIKRMAYTGIASATIFLAFALIPIPAAGLAAAIGAPLASCLCYAPFVGDKTNAPIGADHGEGGETGSKMHPLVIAVIALSFVTTCPILSLFPTNLFFDGPIVGSLSLPGALCAVICAAMSIAALLIMRTRELPLAMLYIPAFSLAAIGFLLSPYRPISGAPLGAAEAARALVFAFSLIIAMKTAPDDAGKRFGAALKSLLIACVVMIACDAAVIALQLAPGFDYSDFVFRTTFSGVSIAALVVLLLGPIPRIELLLAKEARVESSSPEPAQSESSRDAIAQQREQLIAEFAKNHGLTARETEVFALMAAGRDVPYIERELVLAKSTVKTHVKHIYAKCSVSSKQDLLDMLEAFEK